MWYNRIVSDATKIPDFISYYENELEKAKSECRIIGTIEVNVKELPGYTEHRFNQLQEIEAVLNYLNLQLRKVKRDTFKKFLETYQRALTSRDAERYTEGEEDVIELETIINEVALLRNKWLGIIKSFESKNFMLGHLIKLKVAGMEDYTV